MGLAILYFSTHQDVIFWAQSFLVSTLAQIQLINTLLNVSECNFFAGWLFDWVLVYQYIVYWVDY